jgi:hypothetical protein
MGPVRQRVNEMLETFSGMEYDQKLLTIYSELLENRFSQQIESEELEWPEYTDEELEQIQLDMLDDRIAHLELLNREMLFILKSTGIIDVLTRRFVTSSKVSKLISLVVKRSPSAKALEIDLNKKRADSDFCLGNAEFEEFLAKLEILKNNGMPQELITHFVRWNSEHRILE